MWRSLKFKSIFIVMAIIQLIIASMNFLASLTTEHYLATLPSFLSSLLHFYIYIFLYIPTVYLFVFIALITGFQGISLGGLWLVILSIPFILIYSFIFTKIILWAWDKFSKQPI
jgi:hypothetical protein